MIIYKDGKQRGLTWPAVASLLAGRLVRMVLCFREWGRKFHPQTLTHPQNPLVAGRSAAKLQTHAMLKPRRLIQIDVQRFYDS